jgi:hypothetical protein
VIFLALEGDRPRNLEVALTTSEFSHSLGRSDPFGAPSGNDRYVRIPAVPEPEQEGRLRVDSGCLTSRSSTIGGQQA